jgi:hypothetical protein
VASGSEEAEDKREQSTIEEQSQAKETSHPEKKGSQRDLFPLFSLGKQKRGEKAGHPSH